MPMTTRALVDSRPGNRVSGADESAAHLNLIQIRERLSEMLNRLSARLLTRIANLEDISAHRLDVDAETKALQNRVSKLGQLAAGLATIDAACLPTRGAGYGSRVVVEDSDSGERDEYTLMVGSLVDLDANQVSMASPLGRALLGCVAGDEVWFQTPQRRVGLRVISVRTLSDLLDSDGWLDAIE